MPDDISLTINGQPAVETAVIHSGDTLGITVSAVGERGFKGDTGATGPANSLSIGTVVTGTDAAATLTGTAPSQTLNLVLPQGATGQQGIQGQTGPAGPAVSLSVGTVTKGDEPSASLSSQTVVNGVPTQTLSLVLPKGDKGDTGAAGGFTKIQTGTTTTGSPGTQASVTSVTSGDTVTFSFTVPRGVDGTANLGDETPQPLGVASAGTAGFAARADHVHALPTISYANLSGVPVAFPPAAHVQAIGTITGLQDALDGKQPIGTYATLVNGTVPSSQLPGYVDDVVEYNTLSAFPAPGEVGKLFVDRSTNKAYRWSGSTYVEISASPGSTDAVVEGNTNLYFTTARAAAAAPVQSVNGKTGNVTIEAGGIAWSSAPTTTTTTTKAGQISYDESYLYVANAVNQWRRAAIEDWTTPTISISVQPSNQTAVGGTATFSVTASATQNAELLYQWQRQAGGTGAWTNIATGLSATLDLVDLSYAANNGDKYRVVITSGAAGTGGSAVNGWLPAVVVELTPTATLTSDSATLTVSASISIVTQPQNVTLTNGTTAAFQVFATTPGTGLAYQWQSSPDGTNWTNISGATSASYSLSGVTETANGGYRYRCIVSSSGYDDATSNAALLTVAPITVTSQPASQTGSPVSGTTPNYTASFTAAATSPAGAPTIQWEVSTDGGTTYSDLSGQTSSSLSLTGLTSSDSGKKYRAKFEKSGWNTVRSNVASLTVPTDVITVTQQPSNVTASVSSFSSTAYTLPSGTWNAISYTNGKYFATPSDTLGGDYIATSSDGVTWTKTIAALPYAGVWSKVLYGNGIYLTFLAGSTSLAGTWCATSVDGTTWTARQISSTAGLAAYAHAFLSGGGGWFFATNGGTSTSAKWVYSTDGVTWTSVTSSTACAGLRDVVASSDGSTVLGFTRYAAAASTASVTSSGVGAFSSLVYPLGSTNAIYDAIHDGTTFVAVGQSSNGFGQSAKLSGTTWSANPFSPGFHGVAYRNGRYVAVTNAGVASSSDALNWVLRQSASATTGSAVVSTSGGYLATAYQNTGTSTYTSSDGLTWTLRSGVGLSAFPLAAVGNKVLVASSSSNYSAGAIVDIGGLLSASISSAATTTFGSPSIQWQKSTNGGATWTNISGATFSPYSFSPVSGDNGARYRAVFTKDSYTTVNSNSATLTVP